MFLVNQYIIYVAITGQRDVFTFPNWSEKPEK